jgi:macrolide-specific efflux system membrane fusion protein
MPPEPTRRLRARRALLGVAVVALAALAAWAALHHDRLKPAPGADALRTVKVSQGSLEVTAAATGTFQPLDYVDVGAQLSGQLKSVLVRPGDVVRRGQLVAEIDDATARARLAQNEALLASVRSQAAAKQAQAEHARAQRDRNARLVERGFISIAAQDASEAALASLAAETESLRAQAASLMAAIEQARTELRFAAVHAPMDGVVVSVLARSGQSLNAAQQAPLILRIADLASLALVAQVSEADVVALRPGMAARFNLLGLAEREFTGVVRQILPAPNVVNNVVFYDVLVEVPRADGLFRIGMTAQIYFILSRHDCMLKIPRAALPADLRALRTVKLAVMDAQRKPRPLEVEIAAANDAEGGVTCDAAARAGLAAGAEIALAAAPRRDKKGKKP